MSSPRKAEKSVATRNDNSVEFGELMLTVVKDYFALHFQMQWKL